VVTGRKGAGRVAAMVGVVVAAITLQAPSARAGCTRDAECKGARICENGRCIDLPSSNAPQGGAAPQPAPAAPPGAFPVPAQAPPATGEQMAKQLFESGRYAEAAAEFEKAYRATSDPALLYNTAVSYRLAGNSERALETYEDYLVRVPNSPNRPVVEERIRQLRQERPGAAAATNGQPTQTAGQAPPATPVPALQGTNGFAVGAAPPPLAPVPHPPQEGGPPGTGMMITGIILSAVGALHAVVGGVLLGMAKDSYQCEYNAYGSSCGDDDDLYISAYANLVMGGALLSVGVPLWIIGSHKRAANSGSTTQAMLQVSSRSVSLRLAW
jgi:tetratricopeptide (TPR) repeat protein